MGKSIDGKFNSLYSLLAYECLCNTYRFYLTGKFSRYSIIQFFYFKIIYNYFSKALLSMDPLTQFISSAPLYQNYPFSMQYIQFFHHVPLPNFQIPSFQIYSPQNPPISPQNTLNIDHLPQVTMAQANNPLLDGNTEKGKQNGKKGGLKEENLEIRERKEIIQQPEIIELSCQCKMSHCIKQYCMCFKNGSQCSDKCNCKSCKNYGLGSKKRRTHKKKKRVRCNCTRSECSKKYCECFSSGKKCDDYCKCKNCLN